MRLVLIVILTASLQQVYGQLREVKGTPNATELAAIARVKQYYKDIKFTNSVTRHYAGKGSNTVLVKTTFNFEKVNNFYFKSYIYYNVTMSPNAHSFTYSMSAGAAYTQQGKIEFLSEMIKYAPVSRTEFAFGTSAGSVTSWVNGEKLGEKVIKR